MKNLIIYTNIHDLKDKFELLKNNDGISSTLMSFDEFKNKLILMPHLKKITKLEKIFLLQKACREVKNFKDLDISLEIISFYQQSSELFSLFHELSYNFISFEKLKTFKTYESFNAQMSLLEQVFQNYLALLQIDGLIDAEILHYDYAINHYFVEAYDSFEFHIDTHLSKFELQIIDSLPNSQKLFTKNRKNTSINVNSYTLKEKFEQIALSFELVEEFINIKKIDAQKIVIISQNSQLKEVFKAYDKFNNLYTTLTFSQDIYIKILNRLFNDVKNQEIKNLNLLKKFNIDVNNFLSKEKISIEAFFVLLGDIPQKMLNIKHLMISSLAFYQLLIEEWLFLWIEELKKIAIESEDKGKIALVSLQEAKYIDFDALIILDFNEGIIPSSLRQERFLNSASRAFLGLQLPLQKLNEEKNLYIELINRSSHTALIHSVSNNQIASNFLYELGIKESIFKESDFNFFYPIVSLNSKTEPDEVDFNAFEFEWSATMLKNYLECKRKFYYQYMKKIAQKLDKEPNDGQILHKILENTFAKKSFYEDAKELRDVLKEQINKSLDDKSVASIYKKMLWGKKLEPFVLNQINYFEEGWRVQEREKRIFGEIGGLKFKGSIDRIDQTATHSMVIDYKSGSIKEANRTKNFEKLSDFQMNIYKELIKNRFCNVDFAYIEILNGGKLIKAQELDAKDEYLFEHIADIKATSILRIEKREDVHNCNYCDYQLLCQRGAYLR